MIRIILAAAASIAVVTPVLADDYYVVRGPDKRCKIVETRPTDTTIVQVGPLAFKTRDEADREIRVLCKDQYSESGSVVIERDVKRER